MFPPIYFSAGAKSFDSWYQNPDLNVVELSAIVFQDRPASRLVEFTAKTLTPVSVSNPVLSMRGQEPPLATQTLLQCTVYHTLQADLKSMMNNIQTREQLDDFRECLGKLGRRINF